jgi:hypothetical protein
MEANAIYRFVQSFGLIPISQATSELNANVALTVQAIF